MRTRELFESERRKRELEKSYETMKRYLDKALKEVSVEKTSFISDRARNTTAKRYGDSTSTPQPAVIDILAKYIIKVKKVRLSDSCLSY